MRNIFNRELSVGTKKSFDILICKPLFCELQFNVDIIADENTPLCARFHTFYSDNFAQSNKYENLHFYIYLAESIRMNSRVYSIS